MTSTAHTLERPIQPPSDDAVKHRYSAAAEQQEPALCCPVDYDATLLENLPPEIIEKDYGCGDPFAFVREGDVVVDLGSGGGKLCDMTSQLVGPNGRVIGVDCNQVMLQLARKYKDEMADKLGDANVDFRYGRIQELALELDVFHQQLGALSVTGHEQSIEILNLMREPYAEMVIAVESIEDVSLEDATAFDCRRNVSRHPRETKGLEYHGTRVSDQSACDSGSACC